jgi:hypothetical protein
MMPETKILNPHSAEKVEKITTCGLSTGGGAGGGGWFGGSASILEIASGIATAIYRLADYTKQPMNADYC